LQYHGPNHKINGLIKLVHNDSKYESLITFCGNELILPEILANPRIVAIITTDVIYQNNTSRLAKCSAIISPAPMQSFYSLHQYLFEHTAFYNEYDFAKTIGDNCSIHPSAIVENGVKIGRDVRIGPFACIKRGTTIANNCIIDANTIIGGDGFEVKCISGSPKIIHHSGGVQIDNNVEIGSGCAIDKSMLEGSTIVGENTKIDNMVQVAHNCTIGRNVLICANVQVSGSVTIGDNCYLAPSVNVRDQVRIVDNAFLGIGAVVTRHISKAGTYIGIPARPIEEHLPPRL
jgi:UDP-3-O-[3-hydroxymyristoyl] glucosamine N-acyltransferase